MKELLVREFEEELELLEREYEEALEERSPAVQAKTLLKIGTFLGKSAKWVIPAAGAAGIGIGMAGKLRSRELTEDLDVYERGYQGGALDELD
ncbi:hypothetical protein NMY22_g14474 [Coprinellus aureogranulatus]|nr:hypothetical protein NMY22_g14474 [Coprinellus aureogranulatus]